MKDTPLFQGFDDNKKRQLTKESIKAFLLRQAKSHIIVSTIFFVAIAPFAVLTISNSIPHFTVQELFIAILSCLFLGGCIFLFVKAAREYAALRRGAFTVTQDSLVQITKRTWLSAKHIHEENVFRFESGRRFSQTLSSDAQTDLACGASNGDVFYLILLDYKPSKPRYVYNSKYYEYTE